MTISNLYHIDYNITTKEVTINEGLYQSDSIKSERKNHFGQPIFDLEDNQSKNYPNSSENSRNFSNS